MTEKERMGDVRPGKVIAELKRKCSYAEQRVAQLENIIVRAKQAMSPFGAHDKSKLRTIQILVEAAQRPGERGKRQCSMQN